MTMCELRSKKEIGVKRETERKKERQKMKGKFHKDKDVEIQWLNIT